MESLFKQTILEQTQQRIQSLSPNSTPQWGKMDVSQMLNHCQFPFKIALQKEHPKLKPNFFAKILFKKALYNDMPWKKKLTYPSKI